MFSASACGASVAGDAGTAGGAQPDRFNARHSQPIGDHCAEVALVGEHGVGHVADDDRIDLVHARIRHGGAPRLHGELPGAAFPMFPNRRLSDTENSGLFHSFLLFLFA